MIRIVAFVIAGLVFGGGCVTGPDGANTPLPGGGSAIYGTWRWIGSTGGFAGIHLAPPPEETVIFLKDGTFLHFRDDTLIVLTSFTITKEPTFIDSGLVDVVHYGNSGAYPGQKIVIRSDTLLLDDLCIDCFNHAFVRVCRPGRTPLEGVEWRVRELVGPIRRETVISEEDTVTAFFYKGTLTGRSAGLCANTYQGHYRVPSGNDLTIGALSSSKALCPGSRYWDYLTLLQVAASYSLNEERLVITGGPVTIMFGRVDGGVARPRVGSIQ